MIRCGNYCTTNSWPWILTSTLFQHRCMECAQSNGQSWFWQTSATRKNSHATILSAYASAMTSSDEIKDKFCDDLDPVISATPQTDKLIFLGNNARVGTDHQTWEGVIGTEGVGKCNSNGRAWTTDHQQSSVYQLAERQHGYPLAPNTGISLTTT